MTDNPFQPPGASLVLSPPVRRERGPAPSTVKYGVKLLWLSAALLILNIIELAIGVPVPGGGTSTFVDVAGSLITIMVLIFFAKKISAARNWARWVYAIGVVIGFVLFIYSVFVLPDVWSALPVTVRTLSVFQGLIQDAAAILLFLPASNAWFARIDAA